MTFAPTDDMALAQANSDIAKPMHPLRPILVAVFTLKFAVAALLLTCVSVAPPVAAEGGYFVAE